LWCNSRVPMDDVAADAFNLAAPDRATAGMQHDHRSRITSVSTVRRPTWLDQRVAIREFVERALLDSVNPSQITHVTVPAPSIPITTFLNLMPRAFSFAWNNPPSGVDCAGGGVTHHIAVSGAHRLKQLREQSEALWKRVRVVQHPDSCDYSPRLFGGLAFAAEEDHSGPWVEFGDGAFTLPRWTYGRRDGHCFLALALCPDLENPNWLNRVLAEFDDIVDVAESSRSFHSPPPEQVFAAGEIDIHQLPIEQWKAHLSKIRAAIGSGEFLKVVAARRCDVNLPRPVSDIHVLDRLMMEKNCTHFAFRRGESSFVGASPESLFVKSGSMLTTQALAGTCSRWSPGETHAARSAQLLASSKDRAEHEFVVTAIRDALGPLCTAVKVAAAPEVVILRNILHINTPFEATVRPTTHIADLLEALHPTPAVGGVPGHAAREWIVKHEYGNRGWYSGPVGWLDMSGDAEFRVAIRCGVLNRNRAYVFTGAGVVADSDDIAEYLETGLKQQPMLRALQVL
jgi:isochorismate synthase